MTATRRTRCFILVALFLSVVGRIEGQQICAPPLPDWLLPSEENYSSLKNAQKNVYDRLHYIPLGEGNSFLTVGGQVRQWYETFRSPPFGLGPKDDNGYLLQRYMLHFDAHLGNNVRIFVDLKGNLENGRTGGPRPDIDVDRGDIHQAFVDVSWGGRQERFLRCVSGGRKWFTVQAASWICAKDRTCVEASMEPD